ncbi:MAG: hypothetical protein GY757_19850 [bacterium]|nr:hypothetical protein [bacterium]
MALKERYLKNSIVEDLSECMVFTGGPRQVGKTTLSRDIIGKNFKTSYYNWDKIQHQAGKGVSKRDFRVFLFSP